MKGERRGNVGVGESMEGAKVRIPNFHDAPPPLPCPVS